MARNNAELLIKKLEFLKFQGYKISVFYCINSPNMIVKLENDIKFFNSQKEFNWFMDDLIEKEKTNILLEIERNKFLK